MKTSSNRYLLVAQAILFGAIVSCDSPKSDPTAAGASPGGLAPLYSAKTNAVPGRYIVVLKDDVMNVTSVARDMVASAGGELHSTYKRTLRGFSVTASEYGIEGIRRNPNVAYVEQDAVVRVSTDQTPATFGLDRIDQRSLPLNNVYGYTPTGTGVTVYIIDTGIYTGHNEFGGRATAGAAGDFVAGGGTDGQDCNGHGTHVAGTVGGTTYGVAKAVALKAVRVLDCGGSGLNSWVISGIEYVVANKSGPTVANMSLGGGLSNAVNAAVAAATTAGVVMVVAAGNDNINACLVSPASAPSAITVGATTSQDLRASFSNWGQCLDIFAPGQGITSSVPGSPDAIAVFNGTSMAAPHVAGVAALYLQGNGSATNTQVTDAILNSGTLNKLAGINIGSPNILLYSRLTASPTTIALNPIAVSLAFVRDATASSEGQSQTTVQQNFKAAGDGDAKMGAATVPGTLYAATTATTLSAPLEIRNVSSAALEWSATSSQSWLTLSQSDGLVMRGAESLVFASANSTSLSNGTHNATLTITDADVPGTPQTVAVSASIVAATPLVFHAPVTGLSGAANSRTYFMVTVPDGVSSASVAISGGTGDADLYVKFGSPPTLSSFDCRPFLNGNSESCTVAFPVPGTYYIMIDGFFAYNGLSIVALAGGAPNAPPSGLSGSVISSSQINLTWTDNTINEGDFQLQRRQRVEGVFGSWAQINRPAANATSYNNTGLTAGTTYQYRIRSCNTAGCSSFTSSGELTTTGGTPSPPAKPTGLVATMTSLTSIDLTWNDNSGNEVDFSLERREKPSGGVYGPYGEIVRPAANVVAYSNGGLTTGSEYQYRIRACNAGGCSDYAKSAAVLLTTIPDPPTNVVSVQTNPTTIRTTWTDPASTETKMLVQRRTKVEGVFGSYGTIATLGANAVAYSDATVAAGEIHQYRIRACNGAGCSSAPSGAQITVQSIPSAPTTASGSATSSTTANLTWVDTSGDETFFEVWRRPRDPDLAYILIATPAANTTLFGDTGLSPSSKYQYRVRACNAAGCSPYAISNNVITPGS